MEDLLQPGDQSQEPHLIQSFDYSSQISAVLKKNGKDGAFVGVQNLSYQLDPQKKRGKPVAPGRFLLSNISFHLKPGTMTLVLGPPGCGKTTLFKILADRIRGGQITGLVHFDGKPIDRETHPRDVSYITQADIHIPSLTLKETLMFSAECQMPEGTTFEEKEERVDCVMKMLGIYHRKDVVIGDQELRGLSGGEKKRATIAIEAVKAPRFICLDEPTTGLDSRKAYEILQQIQAVAKIGGIPVISSLLQPSFELASLFDNLLLLNQGELVYFGPLTEALPYFKSIGFVPKQTENPADFLQNICQNHQLYIDQESKTSVPSIKPGDFKQNFLQSQYFQNLQQELDNFRPVQKRDGSGQRAYPTTLWRQTQLCVKREFVSKIRNPLVIQVRFFKAFALSLILGTLYFDLGNSQSDSMNRIALLFFLITDAAMSSMVTIPNLLKERTVFYEQKFGKYFQPLAYFIGLTLCEFPIALVETLIGGTIVYWLANFNNVTEDFIFYLCLLYVSDLALLAYCRFCSSIAPSFSIAVEVTPATIAIFLLFGGYMTPPDSMPEVWRWLYWVSPTHYAFQALSLNEFLDQPLSCSDDELVPPSDDPITWAPCPFGFNGSQVCGFQDGNDILDFYDMEPGSAKKENLIIVLICQFVFVLVLNFLALQFLFFEPKRTDQTLLQTSESGHLLSQSEPESEEEPELIVDPEEEKKQLLGKSVKYSDKVVGYINRKIVGASLYFRDLSYVVPKPDSPKEELLLLDRVSGGVKPGGMLALMGASGAGKSTLLDVLSDRKTAGSASGTININGKPRERTFKQFTGYVEQQDSHIPTQTVREAVEFSAILRLPSSWSIPEKIEFAQYVLDLLNLVPISSHRIGVPPTGISFEQRKRLTIAVELAANPTLIFLDEPTTGLDSTGAEQVMIAVKNIANSGRSIICTIHQPSQPVFMMFTDLLLLKAGGKVVYFGPMGYNCSAVINYFTSLGFPFSQTRNPADYILEISGTSNTTQLEDQYKGSELFRLNEVDIEQGLTIQGEENTYPGRYATDFWLQLKMNIWRCFLGQLRRREVLVGKLVRSLLVSFIVGTLYYQQPHTQIGAQNRAALCFFGALFSALNSVAAIPLIVDDRAAYYREYSSGTYRSFTYLLGILIADLPFNIISQVLFTIPVYYLSGMNGDIDRYLIWFLSIFLSGLCYNGLSQLCSAALPTAEVATALTTSTLTFFTIFAGFLIPKDTIPDYWIWVYHISIHRYVFEALAVNEFRDTGYYCTDDELVVIPACGQLRTGCQYTSGDSLLDSYDLDRDLMYWDLFILVCYFMVLTALTQLALRFVRVIKR